MALHVATAVETELSELADVAARTFPLACPPSSAPQDIVAFVEANLSAARFAEYHANPERVLLTARDDGMNPRIIGYAMLVRGVSDDTDVQRAVTVRPAVELNKMYVLPDAHGAGVAATLMDAALHRATDLGGNCVWLGVNQQNQRAQRFYAKHGFTVAGTKTFWVGPQLENDYVMVRDV
ncbi:MAG: acetyltransferase [Mycobacterium sp.]|jgi:ribosomal protein S18 acetylase RimI-like enzyme|nr:acetyltransferase [Mycobacterium sp.]